MAYGACALLVQRIEQRVHLLRVHLGQAEQRHRLPSVLALGLGLGLGVAGAGAGAWSLSLSWNLAELRLGDSAALVDVPFFEQIDDAHRVVREGLLDPILHGPRVLGREPHLDGQTQ